MKALERFWVWQSSNISEANGTTIMEPTPLLPSVTEEPPFFRRKPPSSRVRDKANMRNSKQFKTESSHNAEAKNIPA